MSPTVFESKVAAWLAEHPTCETCDAPSERVSVVDVILDDGEEGIRLGTFCMEHGRSGAAMGLIVTDPAEQRAISLRLCDSRGHRYELGDLSFPRCIRCGHEKASS